MPVPRPLLPLALPLATLLLAPAPRAQTATFRELPQLVGASAAVHDPLRGRTWFLMPGSPARLFEWDGNTMRVRPGELDAVVRVLACGFDPATGWIRALGFDQQSRLVSGTHDGCRWFWQSTAQYLSPNNGDPIAYDQGRGRFVIYQFHTTSTSRVVEFDGTAWTTTTHPQLPWRHNASFAYDPLQNHCVLWGGIDGQGVRNDAWTWNGSALTPFATNAGPGPRTGATFTFSTTHGGLLLYGDSLLTEHDTWVLAGATWTLLPTTTDPGVLALPVLADDGAGVIALGLSNALRASGSRLQGNQWTALDSLVCPAPRQGPACDFDRRRGELVVLGGTPATDEWMQVFDGHWHQRQPNPAPARRGGAGFAWSAVDQALLLHGGSDPNGVGLGDTWTWDGVAWRQLTPPLAPPPRLYGMFAGDPGGGVLLYGGFDGTVRGDHWRWNGTTWQQLAAAGAPGPVFGALGALDEVRGNTVMLGSFSSSMQQTWEWDGAAWALRDSGSHPTVGTSTRMAFDPGRGQVITVQPGVQAWNGSVWQSQPYAGVPPNAQAMLTDTRRGGVLMLGNSAPLAVTTLTTRPARGDAVGSACATSDPPALRTLELPALGKADFALDLGSRAASAPWVVWFGVGGPGAIGPCAIVTGPTLGIVFGTTGAGGNARVPLPVPDDRVLLGLALLAQGAVWDAPRSPIGSLTLSAGLSLAVGW